jgi:hypothetical protein
MFQRTVQSTECITNLSQLLNVSNMLRVNSPVKTLQIAQKLNRLGMACYETDCLEI